MQSAPPHCATRFPLLAHDARPSLAARILDEEGTSNPTEKARECATQSPEIARR